MLNFSRGLQLSSSLRVKLMTALMVALLAQPALSAQAAPASDSEVQIVVKSSGESSQSQEQFAAKQTAQALEKLNKDALRSACDLSETQTAFVVNRELGSILAANKRLPDMTLKVDFSQQVNPLSLQSRTDIIQITAGPNVSAASPEGSF